MPAKLVVVNVRRVFLIPIFALLMLTAAGPATMPASPGDQIKRWFTQLNDDNAAVREKAACNLMGMSRSDLDRFHEVISQSLPLAPGTDSAIEEIVRHVVAATEPCNEMPGAFLGLQWQPTSFISSDDAPATRLPGTCAQRYLHEGDIILGLRDPATQRISEFRNESDLQRVVGAYSAHAIVDLYILRLGQEAFVEIQLDARPDFGINPEQTHAQLFQTRLEAAERFWNEHFQPLLSGASR